MFEVPKEWHGQRIMLRFGAVDYEAKVFVNGKRAGMHRGGCVNAPEHNDVSCVMMAPVGLTNLPLM